HVLQPVVMSRTVNLNPLGVLLSVLVGVELAGFVGALLAIPAAGVIQVVVRDLWDDRQARLKPVPTVGTDETPIAGAGSE
ncbi:MAG TPA: AI-2E family transporter, partial [Acidimicrobiia bacterium]|nr:AI-2E family transporter [Acidimicrobiia bacterium]